MEIYLSVLNLVTSPRQALGGKVVQFDDDVNQLHFNPATINAEMDNHLALNYGVIIKSTYGTHRLPNTTSAGIYKLFRLE
jgi:hypothetical protein